jgi:hypothetical protein
MIIIDLNITTLNFVLIIFLYHIERHLKIDPVTFDLQAEPPF